MKLPKELTTATKLSKYLARLVFIALPIVGFFLGMRYQEMVDLIKRQEMEANLSIPRASTPTPLAIPTVDPSITANWKTYRAPGVYEISYPLDLFSSRSTVTGIFKGYSILWPELLINTNDSYYQKTGGVNFRILIVVIDNPKKLSLENPVTLFNEVPYGCQDDFRGAYPIALQTELLLDGTKALRRNKCMEGLSGVETHIITVKGGKIYNFIVEPSGLTDQDKKILDQILSTFQFLP